MTDYRTIEVEPLTVAIGGVVTGADLHRPLPPEQADEIRAALVAHGVLFFRGQDLTDEQHRTFASTFGPLNETPYGKDGERVLEYLEDTPDSPPKADLWHTDLVFQEEPPDHAILCMRSAPPTGGDTLWLSLYAAYDSLSPTLQRMIDPLEFEAHRAEVQSVRRDGVGSRAVYQPNLELEGCTHPLVRLHPVSGRKALFMGGAFIRRIVGMHPDESDALIRLLRSRLDDPSIQCRWRWRDNDVVVWDERCTNHRATSDHYPHYRLVRRCTAGHSRVLGPTAQFVGAGS